MKKIFDLTGLGGKTALSAIAACVLSASSAKAGLMAGWTIPTGNTAGLSASFASSTPPVTAAALAIGVTPTYVAGTTVNAAAAGGSTATSAFSIGSGAAGDTITIHLSGLGSDGLSDFILTYAAINNGTTVRTPTWEWSTAATGFSSTGVIQPATIPSSTSGWVTYTVDFSGVTTINGSANVYFEMTSLTGGAAGASFDNFAVTAVPEPVSYGLGVFGLVFAGGCIGRFYLGRRRSAMAG